ncbi:CSK-like protein, partial [Mya arenaria]
MPMAETWQSGQEVVAVYDFRGTTKEDLPFAKGDVLTIVKGTRDVNWYKAKKGTGEEGMIPATYVQKRKEVSLHAMPWHHGTISRQEAEELLEGKPDGMFLIRDSVHFQGDFTLSVCCDSRVDHYRILTRNNLLEVDGGECTFDSLMSLVEVWSCDRKSKIWFHGKIDRDKATDLLNPMKDGLFLVRESVNFPGDYTLSVCCANKVEHYRIIYKQNKLTIDEECYFDNLPQLVEAESLLKESENGTFLLRESVHFPGDYTLCVIYKRKVEHYRIIYSNNKLTIDEEGFFDNMPQLVEHYTKDADGLCTKLLTPLPKQGGNFFSVSPDDFKSGGWTLSYKELTIGELVGKGEFGDVHKGLFKGGPVAIKKLKDDNRAAQAFLQEASLMTTVRHPNLVSLIGIVQDDTIYLVLEYMGKGNLVEYLRSRGRSVITKNDQINFATDTANGMTYLETRKLVHRDLAARNVLVSDFGLANRIDYNPAQVGGKFPIKWTAPESLRDNKFTSKSDMWSFGILLWEIYSFGRVPYPRIPLADVVMHVERGYRMEAPEGCPPEIYTIMTDAWKKDPKERPTFATVQKRLQELQAQTLLKSVFSCMQNALYVFVSEISNIESDVGSVVIVFVKIDTFILIHPEKFYMFAENTAFCAFK